MISHYDSDCLMRTDIQKEQNNPGYGYWLIYRPPPKRKLLDAFNENLVEPTEVEDALKSLTESMHEGDETNKEGGYVTGSSMDDEQAEGERGEKLAGESSMEEEVQVLNNPLASSDQSRRKSVEEKAKGVAVRNESSAGSKRKVAEANLSPSPAEKAKSMSQGANSGIGKAAVGRGSGPNGAGGRGGGRGTGRGSGRGGRTNSNLATGRAGTKENIPQVKANHSVQIKPALPTSLLTEGNKAGGLKTVKQADHLRVELSQMLLRQIWLRLRDSPASPNESLKLERTGAWEPP